MINWILIMLSFYVSVILLSYYGDYIVSITRFLSYRPIEAEIVNCRYIQSFKGGKYVTIVTYMQYGKVKEAVLSYVKGDQVGNKIGIVTDGNYAARSNKVCFTRSDIIKLLFTGLCAVGLGFLAYTKLGVIPVWLVLVVIGLCVLSIVLYPLYAVSRDYDIKTKLGWLENTKSKSLQQKTDDKILIGVCIGSIVILSIACRLITNS